MFLFKTSNIKNSIPNNCILFFSEVDIEAQFSLNQSRAEEITMREDYGSLNLVTHDDGFGDMGFDTDNPDIMREAIGNEGGLEQVILFNQHIINIILLYFILEWPNNK